MTLARDESEVAAGARLVLLAVPSGVAREVARGLGAHVDGGHFVVHGVRGLVGEAMESISSVVRDETPVRRVGALGGPALAADLLASIAQGERPEVLVGEALAAGKTLEQALSQVSQRVEAVELTARVVTWAESGRIRAPVFGALARGILRGRASDALIRELMTGPIAEA